MNGKSWLLLTLGLLLVLGLAGGIGGLWEEARAEEPAPPGTRLLASLVGTAFTYQGRLIKDGSPVDGTCDLQLSLFDASSAGTQVGTTQTKTNVTVSDGLFTVQLDFGSGAFQGDARWLQIAVRCPTESGSYTTLSPRQKLTAAPYALALPGLRTQQNAESPNLIGGYSGNSVTSGVYGATIGGGGSSTYANRVTDHFGTVGGGKANQAGDDLGTTSDRHYATVGGGKENTASGVAATVGGGSQNTASRSLATVGGGWYNTASGSGATVGGGQENTAIGAYATVAGGWYNTASGEYATVGGGHGNTASGSAATVAGYGNSAGGDYSFAAGRRAMADHTGCFVWADSTNVDFASTKEDQFLVRASNGVRVVKGSSTFANTAAALQAENATDYGEAAWFRLTDASNTTSVLALAKPDSSSNVFLSGYHYGVGRKFHIDNNGTYVAGSDFAESLPVLGDKEDYEPGDVLVISAEQPGAVDKSTRPYDGAVIGVYSTRPGFLGADKGGTTEVGANEIPVAVIGIVPVKASTENGPILPGDLLTTSTTPGHAMKASPITIESVTFYPSGVLMGKALEALEAGTGIIQMVVMLQ